MSALRFERDGTHWSQETWRALDRAVYRWVRAHGGTPLLAATAAWASLADAAGDAALALDRPRHGMAALADAEIARLRNDPLVAADGSGAARPFVLDTAGRFFFQRNHADEHAAADAIQTRRALGAAPAAPTAAELDALFAGAYGAEVEAQRQAVAAVVGRRLFVLTGAPGTGKTTTVLRMLLMLQRRAPAPLAIRIAAPTGKAAQRLLEALREGRSALAAGGRAPLPRDWLPLLDAIPQEALTVHRLLGYEPWRNAFARGRHDRIAADVVVVDEASMLDLSMLRTLLDAVRDDSVLILVGDADQLTSVATGSVLMDLVAAFERTGDGIVRLHHSFRAARALTALNEAVRNGDPGALQSAIGSASGAIAVRATTTPRQLAERLDRYADALAETTALRARVPADSIEHVVRASRAALAHRQLLCALREGDFGSIEIAAALERRLRRRWRVATGADWYAGRAVIVTRNDYSSALYNGDVGLCLADAAGNLRVWFDGAGDGAVRDFAPGALPEHESAFAITVHKSQGSEYDEVAVLLPPDADNRILSRQLLYTAVSRARQAVELWTSEATLAAALDRPIARVGGLRDRLLVGPEPPPVSPQPTREKPPTPQQGQSF